MVNHTSDEPSLWFLESRNSRLRPSGIGIGGSQPGRDSSPAPKVPQPTNWESAFTGSAWQFDERSGEYYLHLFQPEAAGPQLG